MTKALQEYIEFYTEEIHDYKEVSTKKRMLTKWKKQAKEHLEDLREAFPGFLYGDRVTFVEIRNAEDEVQAIEKVYNTLK